MNAIDPIGLPGSPSDPETPDPIEDALLAARMFLLAPSLFCGMVLRGGSPARDALVAALGEAMADHGRPARRLPGHVDDERLLGGIDIASSLSAGKPIAQKGLIEEAAGGALIAPMAERMDDSIAGRLAQALDDREDAPALVLLDDSADPDDAPPQSLAERLAFSCDLTTSRAWQGIELARHDGPALSDIAPLGDESLKALAATAMALGVASLRPLLFASQAARAHAALSGRTEAIETDLNAAVRLVLAPRATRLPPTDQQDQPEDQAGERPEEQEPQEPDEDPGEPPDDTEEPQGEDEKQDQQDELEEMLIEAAEAAIPADLLEQLAKGQAPRRNAGASGSGQKKKAGMRGKPLGARPGMPRGGARLALIDTLRAAVPWQAVRRRENGNANRRDAPILMRKEDLRVRRYEEKAPRVTIFAVDASGSAAAARLAEAKGAVELMLGQAYVTRSEVALVAFRGDNAELLLPPTRSLTRAKRALSGLPGGGGTPLAMGLNAARECAESVIAKGRTASLVILTDGRANIDAGGQPGRKQAGEDAEAAARAIAARGIEALVVDISPRAAREGPALAEAMRGRFLALPRADAKTLQSAITAAQPSIGTKA